MALCVYELSSMRHHTVSSTERNGTNGNKTAGAVYASDFAGINRRHAECCVHIHIAPRLQSAALCGDAWSSVHKLSGENKLV